MTLFLKQCHGILCLMLKLWRCYLQVHAAPQHWHKQTTVGLLWSTSENLDLKKTKKCKGRAGWGLIVTQSCWPWLSGQCCDGLRDLLKGWRLVNAWNTPWTKEGFRRVLALLYIGFDPFWSAWQSSYVTDPKQAIKIQKNVSTAAVLVYGPFLCTSFRNI